MSIYARIFPVRERLMSTAASSRLLGLLVLGVLAGACSEPDPSTLPVIPQTSNSATSGPFTITLSADAVAAAGKKISSRAAVIYRGPDGVQAFSAASGPIQFWIAQVGGNIHVDGGGPADCVSGPIHPGEVARSPFVKSGGYDPGDPNADFYRAFFANPDLVLPPGEWQIGATLNISLDDCKQATNATRVSVLVVVGA
jgi:hypothetical protein